jgi:hypothetical protein
MASTELAIVDDRDASIRYSSGWLNDESQGSPREYLRTSTAAMLLGAKASFTFVGASLWRTKPLPEEV